MRIWWRKEDEDRAEERGWRWRTEMGKIVFCLSALVYLLVRAGACFVFGFNLLGWVLQALVATARRHRLTA
jgi:hypothetical protein